MCIAVFAWQPDSEQPLLLAGNRDEFFARPTAVMDWWPGGDILAGRDLQADGAWLGVTRGGRFALVTNIRNPALRKANAPSRGHIVRGFLESTASSEDFLKTLAAAAPDYQGFNLICGTLAAGRREL